MGTAPQVIPRKGGWPKGKPRKPISNPQQNTPTEQLQPPRATKQRRSTKHPTIQTAVIAKALIGESKTNIAKDLEITRGTVTAILNQTDIAHQVEIGRSRAVSLIPRSLDVAEYRLSKNDGSMALGILRGTQVLQNQPIIANQLNMQANVWLQMKEQKNAERAIILEAEPASTTSEAGLHNSSAQPSTNSKQPTT